VDQKFLTGDQIGSSLTRQQSEIHPGDCHILSLSNNTTWAAIMTWLTDLPDELLGDIVERVHAAIPNALPKLALTCRRFQRLAHPLQWEHVVLPWRLNKKAPIARFIEAHSGNKNIRSVRLRPQRAVMNAFRVGMKNAFDHLDALCSCLSSLERLDTFSIFLDDQVDLRCYVPGPVLARIVRALPPSLLHLELDTECIDRIYEDKPVSDHNDHLCLAISDHMPRLQSLRLRLSCICLNLFHGLSAKSEGPLRSNLRRIFIRLDTSPDIERTLAVCEAVGDCELPLDKHVYATARGDHSALSQEKILNHLLDLESSGIFPKLERCILWSWRSDFSRQSGFAHVRDIATRTITLYPQMRKDMMDLKEMHSGDHEVLILRNHEGDDFFGGRRMMESALLHEVSWTEDQNGIRRPPMGKLRSRTTHLCTDGLVSLECVQEREAEHIRQGGEPYLRHSEAFAASTIGIKQM